MCTGLEIAAIAGAAISAVGAVSQGMAAKSQGKYQAKVLQQQAEYERQLAAQKASEYQREQSRLMAMRRALLGGTGTEASSGSPLLVSSDMAREIAYNTKKIKAGGEASATRLDQQAAQAKFGGKQGLYEGIGGAASSLITGASSFYTAGEPDVVYSGGGGK